MSIRTQELDALAAAVDLGVAPDVATMHRIKWIRRHPVTLVPMLGLVVALTTTVIAYMPSSLVAAISVLVAVAWCGALPPETSARDPR